RMPRDQAATGPAAGDAPGDSPVTVPLRDRTLVPIIVFGVSAVLIATGQFASFTYIRPYLEGAAGIEPSWVATLLLVYGLAGIVGVVLAGALADRMPRAALVGTVALFVGSFLLLAVAPLVVAPLAAGPTVTALVIAAMAVWGVAMGALFPLLQSTLMRVASERTRTLASAGIVVFFNVGITIGPWAGGALLSASPTAPLIVSALLLAVAGILVVVGLVLARERLRATT
ncbi:MFS transporter, partial [Microbacterium sp.]|uniref:MFS transporter n=1 Tax=Microbacterium sp. TaxID=51671 RepID=UPI003C711359